MKAISNLKEAKSIAESTLNKLGLDFSFIGMSDANGFSVYFNVCGIKVRFSNHQITNINRLQNELCFYFYDNEFSSTQSILKLLFETGSKDVVYGKIDYITQSGKVLKAFGYSKVNTNDQD
jgi:hypothetical protein